MNDDATAWDFLTLVSWWNLCGLPLVLVGAAALVFVGPFSGGWRAKSDWRLDGMRIVRLVSFIHIGLALRASIALVQELLTLREMGVAESFPNLILAVLGVLVNPPLALGLWRRRPAAWWLAILWYAFLSVVQVIVIRWLVEYHVKFERIWWPSYAAGRVLPFCLLVVMFLPRTRRAFATKAKPDATAAPREEAIAGLDSLTPQKGRSAPRWSLVSALTLLFLIVVVSTLALDAADWIDRLVWPPE